jgi:hypothetical protein
MSGNIKFYIILRTFSPLKPNKLCDTGFPARAHWRQLKKQVYTYLQ